MGINSSYESKKGEIKQRLKEFKQNKDYCIQKLKELDFKNKDINPVPILIQRIRFHNNKGTYLLEFKKNQENIFKNLNGIKDNKEKRMYLVKNVKGLGLKEASHFLRNTGHENLAILDRHILKNLAKLNIIELPKTLTPKIYFEIENKFQNFSKEVNIPMDELDLLFWSMETGEIFK